MSMYAMMGDEFYIKTHPNFITDRKELRAFVEKAVKPNRFLAAILRNDFMEAMEFKEGRSLEEIILASKFVLSEVPVAICGSNRNYYKYVDR